jgi:hypothetical protein
MREYEMVEFYTEMEGWAKGYCNKYSLENTTKGLFDYRVPYYITGNGYRILDSSYHEDTLQDSRGALLCFSREVTSY